MIFVYRLHTKYLYLHVKSVIIKAMSTKIKIAIFASGNGSNAKNIYHYFKNSDTIEITTILCNKKEAFVFQRARNLGIEARYFPNSEFREGSNIIKFLKEKNIDIIVLAGFLLKIPQNLINAFPKGIINIHPALLPNYGGKGMYGDNVHKAVLAAGDTKSGITIHLINENYDQGKHLLQVECDVLSTDTHEDIASKVHALEYKYFPICISDYISNTLK